MASCLRQHAPHLVDSCHFAGASAGAIVACCLLCDCCLGDCTTFTLRLATKARSYSLGPLHPRFKITKILRDALREVLPEDAHVRATGRLFISLTRVSDRQNIVVSEFSSKEELIQALMCSAHVPLYSGIVPPTFRGVRYLDGGLSDNIPALNEDTISISPFAGESDICPCDGYANPLHIYLANTSMQCTIDNLYRMSRALLPPHPKILSSMCQQGFDDCLKFLQNNQLLTCVRHLCVRSVVQRVPVTHVEAATTGVSCETKDCVECKKKVHTALLDKLPHKVGFALQEACDSVNQGLKAYIERHRSLRLMSFLATPWFLPVDIGYTYAVRFLEYLPHLPSDVQLMYRETADMLQYLVSQIRQQRHRYTARFQCQLAITEVNYGQIETDIYPSTSNETHHGSLRNLNFQFAVDLGSQLRNNHNHINDMHIQPALDDSTSDSDKPHDIVLEGDTPVTQEYYDTFEQCLHVTNQMESIMAYHYWDDTTGCMQFEEIFSFQEEDINMSSLSLRLGQSKSLSSDNLPRMSGHACSSYQSVTRHASSRKTKMLKSSSMKSLPTSKSNANLVVSPVQRSQSFGQFERRPRKHTLKSDIEEFIDTRADIILKDELVKKHEILREIS